ncbi:hypothetical protein EDB86DRAFT_3089977 [Lactarius hatsudake]|nr:hypothetical protein EDB86DRAFT_3089977 [Lactarius hatsudake]
MLRAMRMRFDTDEFSDLWKCVQEWVKTPNQSKFDSAWEWIQTEKEKVPESFVKYLKENWMGIVPLWAGIARKNRTIFQEGDTNMLIEAYHHVLKSKWLEGKQNRRMDYLIHRLVILMLLDYESKHDRQEKGFEGPDLAKKRRAEILARTPEVDTESIRDLGDDQFSVQSSHSLRTYSVELSTQSCDCLYWPRVQLCKHVAAVAHFLGTAISQQKQYTRSPTPRRRNNHSGKAQSAFLSDGVPSSPRTIQSLQLVEAHLTAVVENSRSSDSPLPDKEVIPPNQGTWSETAERMGAKRQRRRPRPSSALSPEPPVAERIGDLNRKRPRIKFLDPYSGGVRSGRDAVPDAQSAAQNAEARAAAANGMPAPLTQPSKRGRKRAGIPALSQPSLAPPPSASTAPVAWHTLLTTQAAPASSTVTDNTPSQTLEQRHVYAGTSSAPAPLLPPTSAWYPIPNAYHPGMSAHAPYPYHTTYPSFWPYGYLPPSQPHLPPPQQ